MPWWRIILLLPLAGLASVIWLMLSGIDPVCSLGGCNTSLLTVARASGILGLVLVVPYGIGAGCAWIARRRQQRIDTAP